MEAADWASLSDEDLLERRISNVAFSAGKASLPYPQLIDQIIWQGMKTVRG